MHRKRGGTPLHPSCSLPLSHPPVIVYKTLGEGVRRGLRHPPIQDQGTHPEPRPPAPLETSRVGGAALPGLNGTPGPPPSLVMPPPPPRMELCGVLVTRASPPSCVQRTIKSSENTVQMGVFVGHAVRYSMNAVPKPGT